MNAIGRRSSTRLFALLGKAHSKWWYETDLVEFDPRWGKSKKRVLNAIGRRSSTLGVFSLFCLEKPTQNGGMKPTSRWGKNAIGRRSSTRLFALLGKAHSVKTRFERNWTTFINPAFCPVGKAHSKWLGMKATSWYSIRGVFFRFAPMGKVGKTRFERNWTTFVNPAFCPAWKSPLKMVV